MSTSGRTPESREKRPPIKSTLIHRLACLGVVRRHEGLMLSNGDGLACRVTRDRQHAAIVQFVRSSAVLVW